MPDPLAQIVSLLRPGAPFAKLASASGAWRVRREKEGRVFYNLTLAGRACLEVDGRPPIVLDAGDFVLVPASRGFTMSSVDPAPPAGLFSTPSAPVEGHVRIGDPGAPIEVQQLLGHFIFGAPDASLLLTLLPDLILVRGQNRLGILTRLVADEALSSRPGREAMLERLLEVLLIEALRASTGTTAQPGLLRGLGDPRLAAALRAMHADPARDWTAVALARAAGLSRSAFFARFERELGVTPMAYLIGWRMTVARDLLCRGRDSIAEIAGRLGYGSASAFSTAFSREVGLPPAQYARTAAPTEMPGEDEAAA